MSRATTSDVINIGFRAEQFGSAPDFATPGGMVDTILTDIAIDVRAEVGADKYAAASPVGTDEQQLTFTRIRRAETYLAAAELCRRLAQFERQRAVLSGAQTDSKSPTAASLREQAQMYEDMSWQQLAYITGRSHDGALATGIVQSGALPDVVLT